MTRIYKLLVTFCLILVFLESCSYHFETGPVNDSISEARIDSVVNKWTNDSMPGIAIGVVKNGRIVFMKGYGLANVEHHVRVHSNTVFGIASMTKQFTAACIAILAKREMLSLEDDIRIHIPEFPDYGSKIEIRHLVYHQSGIKDYFSLFYLAGKNIYNELEEDQVLSMLMRQKSLNFTPGDQMIYSNSGYFLLAQIIKKATGLSLKEFAKKEIFEPLKMDHTTYLDAYDSVMPNKASGYTMDRDGLVKTLPIKFDMLGAGGMYSNLTDLAKWDAIFYENQNSDYRLGLKEIMMQTGNLNNGTATKYAYGLRVDEYRGQKTVSHGGTLGGYRSYVLRFPDQHMTFIVLSNLLESSPYQITHTLADILLEEVLIDDPMNYRGYMFDEETIPENIKEISLTQYVGIYESAELDAFYEIRAENNHLEISCGDNKFIFYPVSDSIFKSGAGTEMQFELNETGTSGFTLSRGRAKGIRFVKLK